MKGYFSILLLLVLLVPGCGTYPRFTSDEDENNPRYENSDSNVNDRYGKTSSPEKSVNTNTLEVTTGVASFYSDKFHGRKTANGETYDMHAFTAAHETYPFNTMVRVTNLKNKKSIILRINDRKPDLNGRIIDISYKAAQELNMVTSGIAHVKVEVIEWGKQ